jgi:hypothetical protein
VGLESSLNANAVGNFAHNKCRIDAAVFDANNNTFERLQALTAAFFYAHLYAYCVARAEFWNIRQLTVFDFLDYFISAHAYLQFIA